MLACVRVYFNCIARSFIYLCPTFFFFPFFSPFSFSSLLIISFAAKVHNVSAAQVALKWIVQQNITAVTAASNPEYVALHAGVTVRLFLIIIMT